MNSFITNNNFSDLNNPNTIMASNKNYDSIVIKPPSKAITHGSRHVVFVIDSRQRDIIKFPNPASYTFTLEEEYKDVTSVELCDAQIPNNFFNINEPIIDTINGSQNKIIKQQGNNTLYIQIDNKDYVVQIPPGIYTEQILLDCLNQKYGKISNFIDNNDPNIKISFQLNKINRRVNIISTVQFKYNFNYINEKCSEHMCSNIDNILGFDSHIYESQMVSFTLSNTTAFPIKDSENNIEYDFENAYVIKNIDFFVYEQTHAKLNWHFQSSPTTKYTSIIYILKYSTKCVVFYFINPTIVPIQPNDSININNIEYHYIIGTNAINLERTDYFILDIPEFHLIHSNTKPICRSFTLIPVASHYRKTILDPTRTDIKYFNPPLPRLRDININIKHFNGNLYNFNGLNHYLVFKIICLNQPQKYNNYIPQ